MSTKGTGRKYWLDLFTGTTWQEFLQAGGTVSGFSERRWKTVQKIQVGDYLLCYLTGVSRWVGVLEVTTKPYKDETQIWKESTFPVRVRVRAIAELTPETAVPIADLRDRLSIFRGLKNPRRWTGYVRGSPALWKKEDGEVVVQAVLDAKQSPTKRPVDEAKLMRKPAATLRAKKLGRVTVPEAEDQVESPAVSDTAATAHTEMQWLLLKLGSDMGLDVWVARNDRNRSYRGKTFTAIPHMRDTLPVQFDEATNRTIELIDVLWLNKNAIVAAFEIESTTAIHSGLLRMADLVAMQPNLNIPLYIVAPDERRDRVITEINRPTFSRLEPRLNKICRYVSFDELRGRLSQLGQYLKFSYVKPEFLDEISESCEIEEA